jgi:hypothetical protein
MAKKVKFQNPIFRRILIALISFGLLMVGLKFAVTSANSFGADFSIYWQAGRAILVRGVSPYDSSTTEIIQKGIYGRLAKPGEDQVRYAYPPFSLLAVFPSVGFTYPWAQAYWMALNLVLIVVGVLAVYKKPPIWLLAGLIFFYPISRGIILGQFALIIGAGLILAYGLLNPDKNASPVKQWIAGVLLAWCAMKPHLSGVIILFLLVQSLRRKQWRVLAGMAAGGVALAAISWILVPTWVSDWIGIIFAYVGYVPIQPIIQSWLNTVGLNWTSLWVKLALIILTAGGTFGIFFYWWKQRLPDFIALGWLILINQLVNPNPNSLLSDQIVFLLPLLIWLSSPAVKTWIRCSTWCGFVFIPWILFALYFQGKEPYAVASGLAFLFTLWWLGVSWFQLAALGRKRNNPILETEK